MLASYWNAPVVQSDPMTVFILLMLVSVVKVYLPDRMIVLHFTYKSFSLHTQLRVQLVSYDLWEEALSMKAELRSASTVNGVLCVMILGAKLMPL